MLCGFYWLYQWSKNYALSYLRLYLHINDQHTHEKIFGTALSFLFVCLSIRVFFTDNDDSQDSRGREGNIFYSTILLPPTHKHWDIYLQLCIWYDYHVFLIATLVFSRLLLDENYHLIALTFEWLIDDAMFVCLLDELILDFCYTDLTLETGGFELASTITLVLQANWLTKCASHPLSSLLY